MFCSNCGAKVQDGAKFCSSCGASMDSSQQAEKQESSTNASKKKSGKVAKKSSSGFTVGKIVAIVVGFVFLVVVMIAGMTAFYFSKNNVASTEKPQTEAGESAKDAKETKAKEKDDSLGKNLRKETLENGQEVIYGISSNVMLAPVYAKEFKGPIGSKYHKANPQGKFIGVAIMIGNEQNDAITVNEALFRLIDEKGREYSTSTRATLSWRMENDSQDILTKINPGNSSVFTFFFDVPTDADIKKFKLQGRGGVMGEPVVIPINYLDDFKVLLE